MSVTIRQQWAKLYELPINPNTLSQVKIEIVCSALNSIQPEHIPLSVLHNNCTFNRAIVILRIISSAVEKLCAVTDQYYGMEDVLNLLSEWINTIGVVVPNKQVNSKDVGVTKSSVQTLLMPVTQNDSQSVNRIKQQSSNNMIVIDEELMFECDQEGCDKNFSTKAKLSLHRKRHRDKGMLLY